MQETEATIDHVVALQQRLSGGVAHAVDLLVDLRVFFDVRVGARNIGFGLIVIVVADEVFDRVVGEEALHFAVKLGGQRLVGSEDQRGFLHLLDDLRHGEGLARAGHAEQHLVALVLHHAAGEHGDGGRLVAGGFVFRHHLKPLGDRLGRLLLRHEQHRRGGADQRLGHGQGSWPYRWRAGWSVSSGMNECR